MMETQDHLTATSEMLVRKPATDVFEALTNPDITSRFWFTKGSGRLEEGETITWEWEQFGVQADITVTAIQPNRLIRFRWPANEEGSVYRTVEITLEPSSNETTIVRVTEKGFDKNDENLIKEIAGQTEGWALVLSALKAWLEYGINLNLISDHKPAE